MNPKENNQRHTGTGLSAADIEQIRTFISKRGFTESDLQIEIIDHVACRAEELMAGDPDLTLSKAITKVHSEFGVMGFSIFEDAIRSSLQKRYFHAFIKELSYFLSWKILPGFAALFYIIRSLFLFIENHNLLLNLTGIAVMSLATVFVVYEHKSCKKYHKMLTYKMSKILLITLTVFYQLYIITANNLAPLSPDNIQLAAVLYASFILIFSALLISIYKIQQKAIEECNNLMAKYNIL